VSDIITPNHFEAEILYEKEINTLEQLQQACAFFHDKGIEIVIITRLQLKKQPDLEKYSDFLSIKNAQQYLAITPQLTLSHPINGSGDLFSALYLGHFLLTKNPVQAFERALNMTHKIIIDTANTKQHELKIINNYCAPSPNTITLVPLEQ
ncbi:bifunctional hydroxymethylpyrimidine kinase/phosphomethylpyrimidine kinase, partial [Staphylococcus aureus]|nr:bifunctional hydroxymethylpyrimidine kinase/phosphomethylpyrimidine kinase [Staphylococcus aureus]